MSSADGPRKLPDGWRWVRLGDMCRLDRVTVQPGTTEASQRPYLGMEDVEAHTGRVVHRNTPQGENTGRSNTFAFDERHVLYGKLRPYLNKVSLPDFAGRCSTEIVPLQPTSGPRQYLAWLLRRPETVATAMKGRTGSRMPRAQLADLLRLAVPLPPIPEQRRIAAALDEQMAAVDRARKACEAQLEAANALMGACLREALPGSRHPLPCGWRWVRLRDVCAFRHGGTPPKAHTEYWQGDIPWVSPKDMRTDVVADAEDHITQAAVDGSATCVVPSGTILVVVRSGILARHFPVALTGCSLAFNQDIKAIVPTNAGPDSGYLRYVLRSREASALADGVKKGPTVHSVKSGFVENLQVPLPPLPEQRRIAAVLDEQMAAVNRAWEACQEQSGTISALTAALLRKAFLGEL